MCSKGHPAPYRGPNVTLSRKKLAEVFDALADYVEENELQKYAAAQSERTARIDRLATSYEQTTGESFPVVVRQKLAKLDADTLDQLVRVSKTAESPESLGRPADRSAGLNPKTVKEAAQQAEDDFTAWIVS